MQAYDKLAQTRAQAFLTFADAIDTMMPALSDQDKQRLVGNGKEEENERIFRNMSTFMLRACSKTREQGAYRFRVFYQDPWKYFGVSTTAQVRELMLRVKEAWEDFVHISFEEDEPADSRIAFVILFRVL
jgi:hypothetical protein